MLWSQPDSAFAEDNDTYTVSFYKRSGDLWVWDVFKGQTVLFGDYLKPQQRMLSYMYYDQMVGFGNVNQLEFTLAFIPTR